MRYLLVIFCVLMLTTTSAWALSDCLKDPALHRTGVITTTPCPDLCGRCDECCYQGTATLVVINDRKCPTYAFWVTSKHALEGADEFWIDGHKAEVRSAGCKLDPIEACDNWKKYGCNWAILRTEDYVPCGACVPELRFDPLCCGEELFYVNIAKCGDIRKAHVTSLDDSMVFQMNTRPDCYNCGAGVYDHCGRLVGIVVNGGKDCCKGSWTEVMRLPDVLRELK